MKIAVCVKQAVDETELKLGAGGVPLLEGSPSKMSAFDKNALEEGLLLKAKAQGELVVFTVGGPDAKKTLKEALAMGADRGVIVNDPQSSMDSLRTAEVLSAAMKKAGPFDLVLCSEGSSDTYSGQVPPMLAELMQVPYVGYARKLEVTGATANADRSLEESVESVEAPIPLVVSVVSEINEPRYPTLIQIMQSAKKPVEEIDGATLLPPARKGGTSVESLSVLTSSRKHVVIEGSPDEAAAKLVMALEKEGVLT